MTPEEKFLVDLNGYLVIKNVLTPEEVAELNAIADVKFPPIPGRPDRRHNNVSQWGAPYQRLIDHPKIVPYLVELIDPKFRLDHDYCIFMEPGAEGGHLHGGEGHEGDHWYKYRDGRILNGLCVITFFLSDAKVGDGGFACIPGTHKSNFLSAIPREVMEWKQPAPYVVQPEVKAGDALFFTEALVHGTMTWRAEHERRALLYKYSPGHSTWAQPHYDVNAYTDLTDQQRRILQPPSVGGRRNVVQP